MGRSLILLQAEKDKSKSDGLIRLSPRLKGILLGERSTGEFLEAQGSYSLPEAKPHPQNCSPLSSTAAVLTNSFRKQLANQIPTSVFDSTNQIPALVSVTNWVTGALDHITNHILCRMAS